MLLYFLAKSLIHPPSPTGASVTEPPKRYVGDWIGRQPQLFPSVDEQLDPLTAKLERLIVILDTLGLEAYVAPPGRGRGRPADDRALVALPGIGAKKLQAYGADVLAIVRSRLRDSS